MGRAALLLIAVSSAFALPASAAAKLPTIAKVYRTIVLNKSIGGVHLGDTLKRAKKVWGPGSKCTKSAGGTSCVWNGGKLGAMSFGVRQGHVNVIDLSLVNGQQYHPSKQLAQIKLHKIHLGSPRTALTSAYKFPVLNTTGPETFSIYSANHKIATNFGLIADGKTEPLWSVQIIAYK